MSYLELKRKGMGLGKTAHQASNSERQSKALGKGKQSMEARAHLVDFTENSQGNSNKK